MTRWRFDADRGDSLTGLRIPATSAHPIFGYLVAFDRWSPHRPTLFEARMIASHVEYVRTCFTPDERDRFDILPFDIQPGRPTLVLHKYGVGDWGYRYSNWQTGSLFTPPSPRSRGPADRPIRLLDLLDLVHDDKGRPSQGWVRWKADRKEVFGP